MLMVRLFTIILACLMLFGLVGLGVVFLLQNKSKKKNIELCYGDLKIKTGELGLVLICVGLLFLYGIISTTKYEEIILPDGRKVIMMSDKFNIYQSKRMPVVYQNDVNSLQYPRLKK